MSVLNETNTINADKNLTIKVYKLIREMMLNYEIIPGQRLVFVDLAKQLGVSRTTVNAALSILATEGFLDFVPHQGYTVHKITLDEAEKLYEIVKIISLGAVENAIKKLTHEKVQELKVRKEAYEKAVAEMVSRGRFVLDQEFHCYIPEMSDNAYLADMFREVYQRIFLRHRIESLPADRARKVVVEHNGIFDAIRTGQVELAKELIKAHIDAGKDHILSHIFKNK